MQIAIFKHICGCVYWQLYYNWNTIQQHRQLSRHSTDHKAPYAAVLVTALRKQGVFYVGYSSNYPTMLLNGPLFFLTGVLQPLGTLPGSVSIASVATLRATPTAVTSTSSPRVPPPLVPTSTLPTSIPSTGLTSSSSQSGGLILSSALDPVPQRLVQRIQAGRFIEMRELLSDNIALHDQLETLQGTVNLVSTPALPARQREVPSLVSWTYCFLAFAAVQTSDPATRHILAYGRLLIREALRHGGRGWQEYDRTFRRLREIDPSLPWNTLLPDLQASTILGQRQGNGTFCHLCRGIDHVSQQCALSSLQQSSQAAPEPRSDFSRPQQPGRRFTRSRPAVVCNSWNMGACIYPGRCNFQHICATCSLAHRARDCADTPSDSPYKQGSHRPKATPPPKGPPQRL